VAAGSSRPYDRVAERRRAVALARHFREAEGLTIAQIAERLGRSPATIKAYFYDRLRLTKDLRIAPRANASLGATRAAFGAFPDHDVAPGLSTAELTPPWPGGTALRPIAAGARPYSGALHAARTSRGTPGAAPVWHAPADSAGCRLVSTEAPDARASLALEAACLQGNRWRCRLGTLTRRLLVELKNAEVDVSSSAASTGASFRERAGGPTNAIARLRLSGRGSQLIRRLVAALVAEQKSADHTAGLLRFVHSDSGRSFAESPRTAPSANAAELAEHRRAGKRADQLAVAMPAERSSRRSDLERCRDSSKGAVGACSNPASTGSSFFVTATLRLFGAVLVLAVVGLHLRRLLLDDSDRVIRIDRGNRLVARQWRRPRDRNAGTDDHTAARQSERLSRA
jgi:transcriptional regulator with XRE-family HTH domain